MGSLFSKLLGNYKICSSLMLLLLTKHSRQKFKINWCYISTSKILSKHKCQIKKKFDRSKREWLLKTFDSKDAHHEFS